MMRAEGSCVSAERICKTSKTAHVTSLDSSSGFEFHHRRRGTKRASLVFNHTFDVSRYCCSSLKSLSVSQLVSRDSASFPLLLPLFFVGSSQIMTSFSRCVSGLERTCSGWCGSWFVCRRGCCSCCCCCCCCWSCSCTSFRELSEMIKGNLMCIIDSVKWLWCVCTTVWTN